MSEHAEDQRVLVDQETKVHLRGVRGTFTSKLLDISNIGMALNPSIDVRRGEVLQAEIQGVKGTYEVEILSKRGLDSPKTRIRFSDELEDRPELVKFVIGLWAERLRSDILGAEVIAIENYLIAAE